MSFPFLFFLIWKGERNLFVILFIINQVTDILDGFLARLLNQQSEFGARLDSIADIITYLVVICGIVQFAFLQNHWIIISGYFLFYFLTVFTGYLKFGKLIAHHSYSSKFSGHFQSVFILVLFGFGFFEWLFNVTAVVSYLSVAEELFLVFLLPAAATDVKGVYWLIKSRL